MDTFDTLRGCSSETDLSNISNSDRVSRHFQSNEYNSTIGFSKLDKEHQNISLNESENSDRTIPCQEDKMTRNPSHVPSSIDEIYDYVQKYRERVLGIDSATLYSDNNEEANNSPHVTNGKECNQNKNLVSDITSYEQLSQSNEYNSTSGFSKLDKEYQNISLNESENSDRTIPCQEDKMTRNPSHVPSSIDEIYDYVQKYRERVLGIDSATLYSDNHEGANNSPHVTNGKECNQNKKLVSDITSYEQQSPHIQSVCHRNITTMSQQQRIGTKRSECIEEMVHEHSLQTSIQSTVFALQDALPTNSDLTLTSSSLCSPISSHNMSDTGLDNLLGLSFNEHVQGSDATMGTCGMLSNQGLDEIINSSCTMSANEHVPMSHSNTSKKNKSTMPLEESSALEENRKRSKICEVCRHGKGRYKSCSGCNRTIHIECHVPKLEEIPEYVY